MKHYFTADCFGENLPDTWESDIRFLNAVSTIKGLTTIDELADLWDKYCFNELSTEYIAKGYTSELIDKIVKSGFYESGTTYYRLERYYGEGIITVVCIPKSCLGTTLVYDETEWKLIYVARESE